MNKKIIIVCIIAVVVFGAGGFYGGMKYQQAKMRLPEGGFAAMQSGRQAGSQVGNFVRLGGNDGGMTTGEIISKDDKSITLKLRDGGSKIIFYSGSTKFEKMAEVSLTEFEIGQQVVATGTANSDGSVTAQTVQLRSDLPQAAARNQSNGN